MVGEREWLSFSFLNLIFADFFKASGKSLFNVNHIAAAQAPIWNSKCIVSRDVWNSAKAPLIGQSGCSSIIHCHTAFAVIGGPVHTLLDLNLDTSGHQAFNGLYWPFFWGISEAFISKSQNHHRFQSPGKASKDAFIVFRKLNKQALKCFESDSWKATLQPNIRVMQEAIHKWWDRPSGKTSGWPVSGFCKYRCFDIFGYSSKFI